MVKSLSLALSHVLADRTAVAKYLQNIYFEGEPAKNRTCAEMALVQNYGFTINDKPRQAIAHEIGLHRISSDEKQKNITSGDTVHGDWEFNLKRRDLWPYQILSRITFQNIVPR